MASENKAPTPVWLIAGLGNPGPEYVNTRHNAGFIAAEACARHLGVTLSHNMKWMGECGAVSANGVRWNLLCPSTYMNLSGRSVSRYMRYYQLPSTQLLVLSDEVNLPVGTIRARMGGSAGGHNGLKSVIHELGTSEFLRVRLGVGRSNGAGNGLVDYVLGRFTQEERHLVDRAVERLTSHLYLLGSSKEKFIQEINTSIKENHDEQRQEKPL